MSLSSSKEETKISRERKGGRKERRERGREENLLEIKALSKRCDRSKMLQSLWLPPPLREGIPTPWIWTGLHFLWTTECDRRDALAVLGLFFERNISFPFCPPRLLRHRKSSLDGWAGDSTEAPAMHGKKTPCLPACQRTPNSAALCF